MEHTSNKGERVRALAVNPAPVCMLLLILVCGCGTTTKPTLYTEERHTQAIVQIGTVAVVPNRLPLNLHDPEKWRLFNWTVVADEMKEHGIEVVSYDATVRAFDESGLRMEDTKASREKYVDLARTLGVDAIAVPYYGTQTSTKTVLIATRYTYTAISTFQFYIVHKNDFIARLDATGEKRFTTGLALLPGIALAIMGAPEVGALLAAAGWGYDLFQTFRPSDDHWEQAFTVSIQDGLVPIFALIEPKQRYSPALPEVEQEAVPETENVEPVAARIQLTSEETIRTAQSLLDSLGFSPGPADGLVGPSTRSAILAFQIQAGLVANGKLDEQTWSALNSQDRRSLDSILK